MKKNSIGIFDSGFGGLTAMKQIRALLPNENILYFGDTARLPYGNKSAETIRGYCQENITFLLSQKIKVLVIACHTACTTALEHLKEICSIPMIGITENGIREVAKVTKTKQIAVVGTHRTITSGVYQQRIQETLPSAKVYGIACPLFVPLVEEGYIDHPITSLIIKEYLSVLKNNPIDTVLLGCTHYPLLEPLLQKELGPSITLIDPALSCAEQTRTFLNEMDWLNPQIDPPLYTFFVSDDPEKFQRLGQAFLNYPIEKVQPIIVK